MELFSGHRATLWTDQISNRAFLWASRHSMDRPIEPTALPLLPPPVLFLPILYTDQYSGSSDHIKTLAEEGDGNTEITGTMALLGGLLTLTR
jgi:hypothetical protein